MCRDSDVQPTLGLAQAAVHPIEGSGLLVESDFSSVIGATNRLSSLRLDIASGEETQQAGVHVFEILARVLKDDRFSPAALGFKPYDDLIFPPPYEAQVDALRSKEILEYTDTWLVDGNDSEQVQLKIEELCWLNAVTYAAGGWSGRKNGTNGKFNADFFLSVPLSLGLSSIPLTVSIPQNALGHVESLPSLVRRAPQPDFHRGPASRLPPDVPRLVGRARPPRTPDSRLLRLDVCHAQPVCRAARKDRQDGPAPRDPRGECLAAPDSRRHHAHRRAFLQTPAGARALRVALRTSAGRPLCGHG